MDKRKKILINKRFQFKTILPAVGLVYFIISVVIAAVIVNAIISNKKMDEIIKGLEKSVKTQRDVQDALTIFTREKNWKTLNLASDKISEDIKINLNIIQENINKANILYDNNKKLLYGIIIFIVLQGGVLFYLLLKTSHRIYGPIYHISQYIRDITDRKYPNIRPLRKNDYFKEFHELIVNMVKSFENK